VAAHLMASQELRFQKRLFRVSLPLHLLPVHHQPGPQETVEQRAARDGGYNRALGGTACLMGAVHHTYEGSDRTQGEQVEGRGWEGHKAPRARGDKDTRCWQPVPSRWLDLGHGQNAEGQKRHEPEDGEQEGPHSHNDQPPVVPVRETLRGTIPAFTAETRGRVEGRTWAGLSGGSERSAEG